MKDESKAGKAQPTAAEAGPADHDAPKAQPTVDATAQAVADGGIVYEGVETNDPQGVYQSDAVEPKAVTAERLAYDEAVAAGRWTDARMSSKRLEAAGVDGYNAEERAGLGASAEAEDTDAGDTDPGHSRLTIDPKAEAREQQTPDGGTSGPQAGQEGQEGADVSTGQDRAAAAATRGAAGSSARSSAPQGRSARPTQRTDAPAAPEADKTAEGDAGKTE